MSYGLFHAVAVTALVQSLDPTMEEFSVGESTVLKPTHGPLAPVCEQLNAACFFGLSPEFAPWGCPWENLMQK